MARLKEYLSLSDKDDYFYNGSLKINTTKAFDDYFSILEQYGAAKTHIFRGCSEARYKLFTSAQRFWIENELHLLEYQYHNFIKKLIESCISWNNETISKFFWHNKIHPNNALAYLSYMQHVGIPTPLLDFTENPFMGLYFAVESKNNYSSDNEIDNYCSLYTINKSDANFATLNEIFKIGITEDELTEIEIDYDSELSSYPMVLIKTDNYIHRMINNIRISNQEGLFFYNNNSDKPIEKQYLKIIKNNKNTFEDDNKFASCINIHKNLKPYLLSKLKEEGISNEYIFPDDVALKEYSLNEILSKF